MGLYRGPEARMARGRHVQRQPHAERREQPVQLLVSDVVCQRDHQAHEADGTENNKNRSQLK